jgi:V/A-type H+-transporting ATPase subunit I
MKKVTLLCLDADREASLEALRELGVVHLVPVLAPQSGDLEDAQRRLTAAQGALAALEQEVSAAGAAPGAAPAVAALVVETHRLLQRRHELQAVLEALERERAAQAPFGAFEPETVRRLQASGLTVKLYVVPRSSVVPDGVTVTVLHQDKSQQHIAALASFPFTLDGREFPLPARSLAQLERESEDARRELEAARRRLAELASQRSALKRSLPELEERVRFLEARDGMGTARRLAYLQGYCPGPRLPRLDEAAARHGWGLLTEDPAPGEAVPTLLSNARWVRPIKAVFDMIGILPGYEEIDVSALFLLFLSLFFAMLVGDAGYGAIFLLLTALARRRFRSAPPQPFALLAIMGACTVFWGIITGTYFGMAHPPALLNRLKVPWLASEDNLKLLCFGIGAVHLILAHAWNGWRARRTLQAIAQLGWIGSTICMFYLARFMVLAYPLPPFVMPLLAVSIVLIVLFMTPVPALRTEWFNHVMLPLTVVSNFMDVISYVRLFAVGMAGLALAMAFNEMAAGLGHGVAGRLGAALILFLGHSLNLVLSAMGVMVHGIRLNALEFSSHIGISWTGFAYAPFERRADRSAAMEPEQSAAATQP